MRKKAKINNALYNKETKTVKMHLHLEEDGFYLAADIPAFRPGYVKPGMDVDKEGIKIAKNIIGHTIEIEFDGDIDPNG
jgi:hypothetical protein